jgi:hypothetical protein
MENPQMHKFLTEAKAQIDGQPDLPLLISIVRGYFERKHGKNPYSEYLFVEFTEMVGRDSTVDDFDPKKAVRILDCHYWHGKARFFDGSPWEMVNDHFLHHHTNSEGQNGDAEAASALTAHYFASLQEQLCDYAVTMIKNNMVDEVIIVRGLKAAMQLRDEKVMMFEKHGTARSHVNYDGQCRKVTYAK